MEAPSPEKLRLRLAAWARYAYLKMQCQSVNSMARRMCFTQTTLNRIIAGTTKPGLDFAAKLSAFSQISADLLLFHDPPEQFCRPGVPLPGTSLEDRPRRSR